MSQIQNYKDWANYIYYNDTNDIYYIIIFFDNHRIVQNIDYHQLKNDFLLFDKI